MKKSIGLMLAMLLMLSVQAQQVLSGTLKDDRGNPIPFATITERGTKNAVQADLNGGFLIKVAANAQLLITAQGYNDRQVAAGEDLSAIVLERNMVNLENVIVTTALGQRRQAKELGYASASLTNKTINQGKAVNVQQALNGKVSGLSVTTTNTSVFENAKINIRGIRSLTGNNQPMLVVDGSPTPLSFLASIPPGDIQDLTVLKSAASAAIYGPDAVNGAILVTTKRGTGNKLTVTVNSSYQAARVAYFPKLQDQFGAGAGEVVDQWGNYGYVPYENQLFGPAFDGSIKNIGIPLEDGSVQTGPYSNLHHNDKKNFWNTGSVFQQSISLAGQDFYFSAEDAKMNGLMPKDENRRTSFRFNSGKKLGKFSIRYGLNYVLQNYNIINEGRGGLAGILPAYTGSVFFQVLQTASNVPLLSYKDWKNNKFAQYSNYYNGYSLNPYWVIDNLRQVGRTDDLIGNVDMSLQILPWLKATALLSGNVSFGNVKSTVAPIFVSDWARANRDGTQFSSDRPGSVLDGQSFSSRINLDYFLSGDRQFGDYSFRYVAGGMIRQDRSKYTRLQGNNLVVPYLYNVSTRSGEAVVDPAFNAEYQSRLLSAYGSVGFGYKGWAFLELTGRNDWDSRLLKQNRSFFYPAANASVILNDAIPALKNFSFLSYAKLRGSYSKSGNVNIGVYALEPTYSQPTGFPYGNNVGFVSNATIPSPDLQPEFVYTSELGIELGFLNNRINFEATYFHQNSDNQILTVSQSVATGYTLGLANAASFRNYGVETDFSLTPLVKLGKGRIDLKINVTYNDNKVTSTLGDIPVVIGGSAQFASRLSNSPTVNNIAVVGMPAFAFQLSDYKRDDQGRVIVNAVTGLPEQSADLVVMGRSLPLWVAGFTPTYQIGNFSASMTWEYKGGHDFYAGIGGDMDNAGISARSAQYGRKRFVFPNSVILENGKYVPNTDVQVQDGNYAFWTNAPTNRGIGTNYFASAAAWRLRELNLSYDLPLKWFGKSGIVKRATIGAIGRNLLLFVPASNQWGDPEFNSATGLNTYGLSSSFQSPAARYFGGSLTVQF